MKPTIGRVVVYRQGQGDPSLRYSPPAGKLFEDCGCNGTLEHPAIITRVWSDTCVNLMVFFDATTASARPSCTRLPELPPGTTDASGNSGWRWPDRVVDSSE